MIIHHFDILINHLQTQWAGSRAVPATEVAGEPVGGFVLSPVLTRKIIWLVYLIGSLVKAKPYSTVSLNLNFTNKKDF